MSFDLEIQAPAPDRKPGAAVPDHRNLRSGRWWRDVSAWRDVDARTFLDHRWQLKQSPTAPEAVAALLGDVAPPEFIEDLDDGFRRAPMAVRITPYLLSLIDWTAPERDPIRRQFLPLGSEWEPDHPLCTFDALSEQRDAVAPGLTHRYPDKALLLALDACPVYCRFCTRSYSIGGATGGVDKHHFRPRRGRWEQAFEYLRRSPQVEDVVVSGGDLVLLPAAHLRHIGEQLLGIPHVRRIRLATKALAVLPQKLLTDHAWTDALTGLVDQGRSQDVHVCVHTHFNHPDEITAISQQATDLLFQRGVVVRNQSVLMAGVNDDADTMVRLLRRLSWINVQPYYVYVHDMVPGVESLRTTLTDAVELEKQVRGRTAGFMTPTFVCDTVGGGGKRDLHSYEVYDRERGIAVYRSPVVAPGHAFYYFDPLRALAPSVRRAWRAPERREAMVERAVRDAGL